MPAVLSFLAQVAMLLGAGKTVQEFLNTQNEELQARKPTTGAKFVSFMR